MDPRITVLKATFDVAHMVFNAVITDLDEETALYRLPGGLVPPAATVIAHALYSEDTIVAELSGLSRVIDSGRLREATGILAPDPSMTDAWLAQAFELPPLTEYAQSVFARTHAFLAAATNEQLDRLVPTPLGTQVTAAEFLGAFGVVHLAEHTGEVAAIKGATGKRGLPF